MGKVFVGHDWAEAQHDVHVESVDGRRLARARAPEGIEGVARFHALVAPFVEDPAEVVIATSTDRGLFVGALIAAGYTVLAVSDVDVAFPIGNPVSRPFVATSDTVASSDRLSVWAGW